jgi:hypothetical protein
MHTRSQSKSSDLSLYVMFAGKIALVALALLRLG